MAFFTISGSREGIGVVWLKNAAQFIDFFNFEDFFRIFGNRSHWGQDLRIDTTPLRSMFLVF